MLSILHTIDNSSFKSEKCAGFHSLGKFVTVLIPECQQQIYAPVSGCQKGVRLQKPTIKCSHLHSVKYMITDTAALTA